MAREPAMHSSYNYAQVDAAPSRTPGASSTSGYSSQSLPRQMPSSAPAKMGASAPNLAMDTKQTLYLRKKRNEGFGMQLGWVLFVQGLSENGVAASEGVAQGDTINKVSFPPYKIQSLLNTLTLMYKSI